MTRLILFILFKVNLVFLEIVFFTIVTLDSYAQESWLPQKSGISNGLKGVHFIDSQNGVAIGSPEIIIRTSDAGLTWSIKYEDDWGELTSLYFLNADTGWVCGGFGKIMETNDGGMTWQEQNSGTSFPLESILFINRSIGWVCGIYGTLIKTVDSGKTWFPQTVPTNTLNYGILSSVHFIDTDNGWVTGIDGIFRTVDGGDNWVLQEDRIFGFDIYFFDSNTGIVVGKWGNIAKTYNGGENWNVSTINYPAWYRSTHFINNEIGWVVGAAGTILRTENGGESWVSEASGTSSDLFDICFSNDSTAWAVGWDGTILKSVKSNVTSARERNIKYEKAPNNVWLGQNYPNPFNATTSIPFKVPSRSYLTIKVYDIRGREISTILDGELAFGNFEVKWTVKDLPSGLYFVQLRVNEHLECKKLLLIK